MLQFQQNINKLSEDELNEKFEQMLVGRSSSCPHYDARFCAFFSVSGVSSSKTTLVHDVPGVIHGPHSLSSFCLGTPHFHRHRLL